MIRLHASCVALDGKGVLLLGESGGGKSDLALRLIDRGGKLVADDQVELSRDKDWIVARAPEPIKNLIEIRGLGILTLPSLKQAPLAMAVRLVRPDWIERLPSPEPYECLGARVPQIRLSAFEASAPIKIEMAILALRDGSMTVGAFAE